MPDDTNMLHLLTEQYAHLYSGQGRNEKALTVYHDRDDDEEMESEPVIGDLIKA